MRQLNENKRNTGIDMCRYTFLTLKMPFFPYYPKNIKYMKILQSSVCPLETVITISHYLGYLKTAQPKYLMEELCKSDIFF